MGGVVCVNLVVEWIGVIWLDEIVVIGVYYDLVL